MDIGTGDGLFVYNWALKDPRKFFIGIDANRRPLQKISERTYRKPSKGGAPNALFLQAVAEDLPTELQGIANEIHVNFPWGSLLRGVATGDAVILNSLRRICALKAQLQVTIGLDLGRDRSEIERLKLPQLSVDYINAGLVGEYKNAGFKIVKTETLASLDWPELQTSWAKRLRKSRSRSFFRIVAQACEIAE